MAKKQEGTDATVTYDGGRGKAEVTTNVTTRGIASTNLFVILLYLQQEQLRVTKIRYK